MRLATILALLAASAAPSLARAQAPAPADGGWVGKRVITVYGTVLNNPKAGLDDADRSKNLAIAGRDRGTFHTYKVEFVNGRWLWLVEEKGTAEGWVDMAYVIPYDQAIDYFTAQIRANPASYENYVRRARIWQEKGELDIAIADLNEAIRLKPDSEIAYVARGNAWHDKKEYDKAITDHSEAIRLDPRYTLAYLNRGVAWSDKKEYDKAIADYAEAIRIDPKYTRAYNGRAWLRATCPEAKSRDGKAAVDDATRACELSEWKGAYDLGTLAAAHAERGDFAKAVEFQEKAQGLYKDENDLKKGRERLALYRAGKPYRQAPGGG